MKLTKASVREELKKHRLTPAMDKLIPDDDLPGFGLRLRPSKAVWTVQYRLGGRGSPQRKVTIGPLENFDLDEARAAARDMLAKVRLGQDPQAEKIEARKPKPQELTLGEAVDKFLPVAAKRLKASTYSGVVLHLKKHWQSLHDYELRAVERRHVAAELGRIAENSGLYGANRSRAALSSFFAWAMGEGICDANPVIGTNKATDEIARDRVLSASELRAVWREAGVADYGNIVRLLILTAQRREEVAGMLWSELDLEGGLWRIGAARTKNGRPHELPLSAQALAILKGVNRRPERERVFGAGEGPFSGWSQGKTKLDGRLHKRLKESDPAAKLPAWRLHDLRRTAATGMADLGVLPHVIEAVLNHISGHKSGVAGVYNRSNYGPEKKAALDLWGAQVAALVGETVEAAQ